MRRCQKDLHDVPAGAPLCLACRRASRAAYRRRHPAPPAEVCGAGHEFTPANTRTDRAGRRRCVTCSGRPRPRPLRDRCLRDLHDLSPDNTTSSRGCKACARAARARRVAARLTVVADPASHPASRGPAEPAEADTVAELAWSLVQAVHHRDEPAVAALIAGCPDLVALVRVQSRLLADAHRAVAGARAA